MSESVYTAFETPDCKQASVCEGDIGGGDCQGSAGKTEHSASCTLSDQGA